MQIYERARIGLNPVFMTPLIPRFRDEHTQIVEAIKRRDALQAKKLIRAHENINIELLDSA